MIYTRKHLCDPIYFTVNMLEYERERERERATFMKYMLLKTCSTFVLRTSYQYRFGNGEEQMEICGFTRP